LGKALLLCLVIVTCARAVRAQAPTGGHPGAQHVHALAGQGVHYVYMVRHGNYDRDTSATDDRVANGLSPLGHEQAKLIGARLATLPVKISHLVSSEFRRAAETADEMGRALKLAPSRDGALNECYPSSNDAPSAAREKPEGIIACDSSRAVQWQRYFVPTPDRDTYDVLVCHGNIIRWTLMRTVGSDTKNWRNLDAANCGLTIIAVRPDGTARLVAYSDVGHIPWEKQTWSGTDGWWSMGR